MFSGDYVFPAINDAWQDHQKELVKEIKSSDRKVELSIDGQCDSPGHSATYCTVTSMDAKTNKVLDLVVVNVKEVKNSQGISIIVFGNFLFNFVTIEKCLKIGILFCFKNLGMEKEGFIRTVYNIRENFAVDVRLISTDRHVQIRKMMASNPEYSNIIHQFDPWHIAKNISKKLTKASKKKGN